MLTPSISINAFQDLPVLIPVNRQICEQKVEKQSKTVVTDKEIIDGIKTQDISIIKYIYKRFFQQISHKITSNSGTRMDAEDLFQDALIVLYQKISKGNLNLTSSFYTFFYSICWHLWLQKLNKRSINCECKEISNLDAYEDEQDILQLTEESETYNLFQHHFLRLNQNDQKVLKLYLSKISMKEIARIMGYKSEYYAKSRKFICKERLKNFILNDPQYLINYQPS